MEAGWNTTLYEEQHAFVWQYGQDLIQWLNPQPGESILDLGCGTGQLTAQLAQSGARVWGIDADESMITKARQNYPYLTFQQQDARTFTVTEPMDAVFSNAVLHWIQEPDRVIQRIYQALKVGGRFVAEFGGQGNVQSINQALAAAYPSYRSPWYFPSIGDYTTRLEQQGFKVVWATLRDRPTPLEQGEVGLSNWLKMFAGSALETLSPVQQAEVITAVEQQLRPTLYREGRWTADYCRLQIHAFKVSS